MTKTLQQTIEAKTALGEKAFVPYIMAGDGGLEETRETILFLQEQGATAIELGIPFSDPVADGPIIEEAGKRALAEGTNLHKVLALMHILKDDVTIPILLMTYLNPIIRYGVANFVKDAEEASIKGLIIPDMPLEESILITQYTLNTDISMVQLVSLTSPAERIEKITSQAEGFVYAVTVNGTTGGNSSFGETLQGHLSKLKEISPIPVLAGFGISDYETAVELGQEIDGVIVGSAIVDAFHRNDKEKVSAFFKSKIYK